MSIAFVLVPCRSDNYAVLMHDAASGDTSVVDTPDGDAIEKALVEQGWGLTHIFTTHDHGDHVEGHLALKERYGATVIAAKHDKATVPGGDVFVAEGSMVRFGGRDVLTIETPGHTKGHIAYYMPEERAVFVGDTLFAMGCGRLLGGTTGEMWSSLQKLGDLPPDTRVWCGHEYTAANARFALTIEPENPDLVRRATLVAAMRTAGEPTVPTTIGAELLTNPFLRADQPEVKAALGMPGKPAAEVFAALRARKDVFRG
jgi:hydroxyacylglutathione hydrolase